MKFSAKKLKKMLALNNGKRYNNNDMEIRPWKG